MNSGSANAPPATVSALPRVAPFAVFMAFVGLQEVLGMLTRHGFIADVPAVSLMIYPAKVLLVGALLVAFRKHYREIRWSDLRKPLPTVISIAIGCAVFVLWINMDWKWATVGQPTGYNPMQLYPPATAVPLLAIRLLGASLLVPVMEELFWRSWLTRYIVATEYSSVPMGRFTPFSFAISALLFGLEHNLVLAGIMAGLAYNFVLLRTRSIAHCIVAHGITNFALGIYVLLTGNWQFW